MFLTNVISVLNLYALRLCLGLLCLTAARLLLGKGDEDLARHNVPSEALHKICDPLVDLRAVSCHRDPQRPTETHRDRPVFGGAGLVPAGPVNFVGEG